MKTRLCLIIAIALMAPWAFAAGEDEFAKSNDAYAQARYDEATAGYEALVQAGQWNAAVFYNLGNARYRLGDFGQAILNYQRALALEPRHPEADANLRLARDEARALELRQNWLERYASMATVKQWSLGATVALWSVIFLVAHLILRRRISAGRVVFIALGLAVGATAVFAILTLENGTGGNALAIVTGKDVAARIATADSAQTVLALPAGSEIKVESERGDWIYAALPNDLHGWIPKTAAERVRM